MATIAARAAAAKLADDVVVIDVSGQLVITDCFVIASASNDRQVNAIVDGVEEKMREAGYKPARREGERRWKIEDRRERIASGPSRYPLTSIFYPLAPYRMAPHCRKCRAWPGE